jgi:uncharacterized membrane protein YdjX (TVP38/TMEM64 family)
VSADALWVLCVLLFADGATFAFATTPLLLQYGKLHEPWQVAVFGGLASSAGSVVQLVILRWLLGASQPWMKRLAPSREKLDAALQSYPSTLFLALVWARLTPLPDAPLKLVAAAIGYPLLRYGLAVYLGAIPYYFVLALLGKTFKIPGWVLAVAVAFLALGIGIDLWRRRGRAK